MTDINVEIKNRADYINDILEIFMPEEKGYEKTVYEAMNYSVRVGGKRLRPMLMEATFQMFGGEGDIVKPFMAAIEFIHTYSLVHDDLPAMDNDLLRRGKKTTHAVYGEAMGILTGDALLNYAFETALKAYDYIPKDSASVDDYIRVSRAMQVLAKKAGVYGMVGGQVIDVEAEKSDDPAKREMTKDKLETIHKLKTSALIESSMMVGAILAGADDSEIAVIERSANCLGLAFQIQDDILDVTSTAEVLGKPIGSDEKNNKVTYVTLEGLEKSKKDVETISNEAINLLVGLEKESEFLQGLFKYLINREK